ncbi:threonine aldolase family protein [Devosia sp.]|uniref:threonine aldolase family protein n=1 Tax=Devosia sp. TaxID=1871048 RepID=UPI003A9064BE
MNFASDNWAGATPEVMAALGRHNEGFAPGYGSDALTEKVRGMFCEVFERDVEVWFTPTGTASNALGLSAVSRPGGMVLCSAEAHIHNDEWGATEYASGGMKLMPMAHRDGLVLGDALEAMLARYPEGNRLGQLVALSLTNATELGTVYGPDALAALTAPARARGLAVHLDGARFANAVAASGATPAELTWRAGVDFMSFGGTKNGCWAAEAVVVFAPEKLHDVMARRQRAGHTFSKARFVAAQFEAYLSDGNWLAWAGHANAMAERLRAGLRQRETARLGWDNTANEVFAVISAEALDAVRAAGGTAHEWPSETVTPAAGEVLVRLVTSWATTPEDVDRFLKLV